MAHAKGFKRIAARVERKYSKAYPGISFDWTMPIKKNPDGSAGGRLAMKADGYRDRTALIFVNRDKSWWG